MLRIDVSPNPEFQKGWLLAATIPCYKRGYSKELNFTSNGYTYIWMTMNFRRELGPVMTL